MSTGVSAGICCYWSIFARVLILLGHWHYLVRAWKVKGNNVEWGWEVPKLSKLFAKIVTKKTSINEFGIRSSWYGHNKIGHDKAMWIHHFLSCSLTILISGHHVNGIFLRPMSILSIVTLSSFTRNGRGSSKLWKTVNDNGTLFEWT